MIAAAWAQTSEKPPDPAQPISYSVASMFSEHDGARTRNLRRDRPGHRAGKSPPNLLLTKDLRRSDGLYIFQILSGFSEFCQQFSERILNAYTLVPARTRASIAAS